MLTLLTTQSEVGVVGPMLLNAVVHFNHHVISHC